jgi:hypothetical protein
VLGHQGSGYQPAGGHGSVGQPRRRDGIEFPVELQTYRLNDEDGNLLGTAAIVRRHSRSRPSTG